MIFHQTWYIRHTSLCPLLKGIKQGRRCREEGGWLAKGVIALPPQPIFFAQLIFYTEFEKYNYYIIVLFQEGILKLPFLSTRQLPQIK